MTLSVCGSVVFSQRGCGARPQGVVDTYLRVDLSIFNFRHSLALFLMSDFFNNSITEKEELNYFDS